MDRGMIALERADHAGLALFSRCTHGIIAHLRCVKILACEAGWWD
jgi:hypothetical protein